MALSPFALLLLRRLSVSSKLTLFYVSNAKKSFSTSSIPSPDPPKPSNLSARMSFVFDQIDAIEKERTQKDETLQRIRAWRESKNIQTPRDEILNSTNSTSSKVHTSLAELKPSGKGKVEVELAHPWPEWIELMERLVQQNYFDFKRKDEDKMIQELGFDVDLPAAKEDAGADFMRDFKTVQSACLNFGKDRFDIIRSLSRQDIQLLVGYGCPSADKKVVFSAKLLRKRVHLDEGDVCSSCNLRNSCERAYLLTNKEDEARTIDVMRVLLAYGFDPINKSVTNESILKQKSVKTVIRKVLHEIVKLSAVPIDPNLPPPVIKKPPPKVKQPPPPPKKRVGRDDIEMKKGDWLCPKCDFMNFAKNTVCLQCDAKRPKRQLLPGEWECPECNFLNYRRNMSCFHCQCKRPPDVDVDSKLQERQPGPRARLEKVASRAVISNAWNFDFDDDESDGADVAAFEYADSLMMGRNSSLDSGPQSGNFRGREDDFGKAGRFPKVHERGYSGPDENGPRMGFNDFDDEDDIDSYELDTQHDSSVRRASYKLAESEGFSDVENNKLSSKNARRRTNSQPDKPPKPMQRKVGFLGTDDDLDFNSDDDLSDHSSGQFKSTPYKAAFSGSDDDLDFHSDDDLSVHPKWKASHVADSRQSRRRGVMGKSKPLTFGSDEEFGLESDMDDDLDKDFKSVKSKARRRSARGRDFESSRSYNSEDDSFTGSEMSNKKQHFRRNRQGENKAGQPPRRGSSGIQRQRFKRFDMERGKDFDDFRNRNRVIER